MSSLTYPADRTAQAFATLVQTAPYLMVFQRLAGAGNVQAAARALELNPDGVRYRIRKLEQHFEARLVNTDHDAVQLTEEGERLQAYARHLVDVFTQLEQNVRPDLTPKKATIGLDGFLPADLIFRQSHLTLPVADAGVTLDVIRGGSDSLRRQFYSGRTLDAALFIHTSGEATKFGRVSPLAVSWMAGISFAAGFTDRSQPLPVVLPRRGHGLRAVMLDQLAASGRVWRCSHEVGDLEDARDAVAIGGGIMLLPESAAGQGVNPSPELNRLLGVPELFLAVTCRSEHLAPAMKKVGKSSATPSQRSAGPDAGMPADRAMTTVAKGNRTPGSAGQWPDGTGTAEQELSGEAVLPRSVASDNKWASARTPRSGRKPVSSERLKRFSAVADEVAAEAAATGAAGPVKPDWSQVVIPRSQR